MTMRDTDKRQKGKLVVLMMAGMDRRDAQDADQARANPQKQHTKVDLDRSREKLPDLDRYSHF